MFSFERHYFVSCQQGAKLQAHYTLNFQQKFLKMCLCIEKHPILTITFIFLSFDFFPPENQFDIIDAIRNK